VLDAGLEVLKAEGYAGLTTAKVAARSGQNKALIAYHFGSKHGLVAAVARKVSESITGEVLGELERTDTVEHLVRGGVEGLWRVLERDERLARLYFDLAAVSVVEPDVRSVMHEMKTSWRWILGGLLSEAHDGPPPGAAEAAAVYVMAGLEGLALERLDRGETTALAVAREMFVRGATAAIARG
jgi:TetR/AcrR family transcriptional regulator, transcriptional repressor of bet genes